ncbi:MAG TPA: hypothetical protein VFV22_01860 [Candidatus Paceibacterota bacterium]|nr:hypothetical protein [Candidatus Paceibacterota bacterium]
MTEVEKQESQKTVVAFVSGLLIGGLLVWVFSSSPENVTAPENSDDQSAEEVKSTQEPEAKSDTVKSDTNVKVGEGSVIVDDQPAGSVITLKSLSLPTEKGWVVVREFNDDTAGNILGAARFDTTTGLTPTTIELIRGTTAGSRYQVVFFTNGGDMTFSLSDDVVIEGIATTFSAT